MFPVYQNYYDFPTEALSKGDLPRKQQVVQIVPDPIQDENGHFACSWVEQGQICGCRYANADDLGKHVQIRHISGNFLLQNCNFCFLLIILTDINVFFR